MYKTIRMLPAALLLLLLGTACTNDPADNPADTGLPLVLENVYIGAQTKAEPYDPGFADGSMLEATIALDGVTTGGTYVYQDGQWTSDATAYWQNTTEAHDVTLRTPEPKDDMPAAFTQDNWHEYDLLEYSKATKATTSFTLTHTRAQLCVALEKGKGLTDDELAAATVTANNIGMLHDNGAHYALFDPGTEITSVNIDINGSEYLYNPESAITLPQEQGQCTILTLKVNKAGVSGITISGEGWQDVTATSEVVIEDLPEGIIPIHSNGRDLDIPDDATALLITGTLNSPDITTINSAKDRITHLYVFATSYVWDELQMNRTSSLESVYLAHATNIKTAAFERCTSLTSINLPNATVINNFAFLSCSNLTNINLPKATSIGNQAFHGTSLTSISLPNATTINSMAFRECTKLTSINLPNARNFTGSQTFYGCTNLNTISLPKAINVCSPSLFANLILFPCAPRMCRAGQHGCSQHLTQQSLLSQIQPQTRR